MTISSIPGRPLVIIDGDAPTEAVDGLIAHWTKTDVPIGHISVPLLVEKNIETLREEYLAWVHELGESRWNGKSVRKILQLHDGFSFWWMTLVAQKNPMKNNNIYELFKLRALEMYYLDSNCHGIVLYSSSNLLDVILRDWCIALKCSYRKVKNNKVNGALKIVDMIKKLPFPIQAFATIAKRYWTRCRYLKAIKSIPKDNCQATVVTYFPNIDRSLADKGMFRSNYLGILNDVFKEGDWNINWIWIYTPNDQFSFRESMKLRDVFASGKTRDRYFFLEEFMNLRTIIKAIGYYTSIYMNRGSLRSIGKAFFLPGSGVNFWRLFSHEWKNSLTGSEAIDNCLMLAAFENIAKLLAQQKWGLYLWENAPWERALNYAWEKADKGKLIGFQHATLRFLDLRFFEDSRSYRLDNLPPLLPTFLAVNGKGSRDLLEQVRYPQDKMRDVEAARYMYLLDAKTKREAGTKSTFLAVTGYISGETRSQLKLLIEAMKTDGLRAFDAVLIKPHPDCPIGEILNDLAPEINFTVTREPLSELWHRSSVAYVANSSSASTEAAYLGVPVIVHVPENSLNFSPLLGNPQIKHVNNLRDFLDSLSSLSVVLLGDEFFCLDTELSQWRSLLQTQ